MVYRKTFGRAGVPLLGMGACLTPFKHAPPPHGLPRRMRSQLVKRYERTYVPHAGKTRVLPLKVTQGHRKWHESIRYLRLPFNDP